MRHYAKHICLFNCVNTFDFHQSNILVRTSLDVKLFFSAVKIKRFELRNKPGDLFSKEALERSYREIASMGHFNAENIQYDIQPDANNGTVDLGWGLEPKSNDQIEFSLGYGQTGVIGKIGLKFANFSLANLFKKDGTAADSHPA